MVPALVLVAWLRRDTYRTGTGHPAGSDAAGRVVASSVAAAADAVSGLKWTCTSYDARSRILTVKHPAHGVTAERTVTHDHAVDGNPLVSSIKDPAGTITTTVDLLGRTTKYVDVWGGVTATTGYDIASRVTVVRRGGVVLALPTYDAAGELASVSYPSGTGNAGNGTTLTAITRDGAGQTTFQSGFLQACVHPGGKVS